MFLHGSGDFSMYLKKANSPEHNSDQEELLNATDPPEFSTDIQAESEAATEAEVTTDVLAESETATEIATAIISAVVESVPVISGGIPLSGKNPAESLDVSPEVAEIIHSVYRGKGTIMATNRRNSTRVKQTTKPRAIYASEEDINSAIGPLSSSDLGSWRKLKKHKVTDDHKP